MISTLRLERNEIGDDGIASIASFLQRNKKHHGLRTLDVAYNDFGCEFFIAYIGYSNLYFLFSSAMSKSIVFVYVFFNPFSFFSES